MKHTQIVIRAAYLEKTIDNQFYIFDSISWDI